MVPVSPAVHLHWSREMREGIYTVIINALRGSICTQVETVSLPVIILLWLETLQTDSLSAKTLVLGLLKTRFCSIVDSVKLGVQVLL